MPGRREPARLRVRRVGVVGTRVQADAIVENFADGWSVEEIVTEIFEGVPLDRARRILTFAEAHSAHPA